MDNAALLKLLELDKDELVLWSGEPAPFKTLDKYYKPVFIRNYLITIIIVASIFTIGLVHNANTGGVQITALAVICLIPLVVVPVSLYHYGNYRKTCKYFLTNKNIITLWESRKLKIPLVDITRFDSVPQSDDTISVRIGKAAGMPIKKNREYALRSLLGNIAEEQNKGCLLYNLTENDAAIVLGLIDKYRVVA